MTQTLHSSLALCLLLLSAWGVVGLAGLIRPMSVRLVGRTLFLLGAAATGISILAAGYFRRGEGTPPGLLPEAHPAAPSPVSALMSGVMLKTALYGLLRVAFDWEPARCCTPRESAISAGSKRPGPG